MLHGPIDPHYKHNVGGIACMAKGPYRAVKVEPKDPMFRTISDSGRLDLYLLDLGAGHNVVAYVFYGYSGSHSNKKLAKKTNTIIEAIIAEKGRQVQGPCIFVGDLNANPVDIPALKKLLDDKQWHDIGANARFWGQQDCEHTCITGTTKVPTRRDYLFTNSETLPMIANLR